MSWYLGVIKKYAKFSGRALYLFTIWLLVLTCLAGTAGSNRFGEDPKAETQVQA